MTRTEDLIESLSADAAPVKRLAPPSRRAVLWLGGVLAVFVVAVIATNKWLLMEPRLGDHRFALELAATLLTGITAVIAAFHVSLPDRSRAWLFAPLPFLVLWIASGGYECYRNWFTLGPDQSLALGESLYCFSFMLGVSAPLALLLYVAAVRTRTLYPVQVMAMGGLGIAGLSAGLLQFFHPFDVTLMDLCFHMAALLVVVALMSTFGRTGMRFAR
jgi:hypothetical protein